MDIYNYLKKDHQKVSRLFTNIIKANTSKERKRLFLNLMQELELHADPEHETFYQALRNSSQDNEETERADSEHYEIKKMLAKLNKISPTEIAKWCVHLGELKNMVERHVYYEENTMFEEGKRNISKDESEEMAERMEELKEKMKQSKSFQNKFSI